MKKSALRNHCMQYAAGMNRLNRTAFIFLLISLLVSQAAFAQNESQRAINGKVTDISGMSLPGVSVFVKGTANGTITSVDGDYSLQNVPGDAVLVFSFIGMKTLEISTSGKNTIVVSMEEETVGLDEVVVVGYGTQKQYSVVASITTINPEKLRVGTTRSMSNNLAGNLAGIISVQRSGEPGYDNSHFWIRGISTFAGSRNPLVLVDGIERSLNDIDPAEIASFSILKDASASAVYGVRGANGVILINTKRGKIGKPRVIVRVEHGFTQPTMLPEFYDAADYLEVLNVIRVEDGREPLYDQEQLDNIRNKVDPDLYPDVNWLDLITKENAQNTRVNFDVSGGSEILRYSMVASMYEESGILERDTNQEWDSSLGVKRYNVRTNVDLNLSPTTLMRFNIGGYLQNRTSPPQSIDYLFGEAFTIPPFKHPAIYSTGEIPRSPERTNPWALATQTGFERSSASKLESLFSLEQDLKKIVPGLKAKAIFSFDNYSRNWVTRGKSPDYYNPAKVRDEFGDLVLNIAQYGSETLGYSTGSDWGNNSIYMEANVNYNQNFDGHYIDAMILANRRQYDNGSKLPFRNQGLAGRLSYSFKRRLTAEVNFGYNGSENFADGQRYGFFPSVAAGWLISEEKFMENVKSTFSKIKIRGSYGLVGNDNLDGRRFAYLTTIGTTGGYNYGTDASTWREGIREGEQGNPDLTWETVTKANIGLELGLWNSVMIVADLFKEHRRDIFMQRRSIPGSSGFISLPWANYGQVNNQGVDLSMDMNKQVSSDLFVSLRGTFTYAVNEIIEQDEPAAIIGTSRSSTGYPVGQFFGLEAIGLFEDADFADIASGTLNDDIPDHSFGPVRPGDIRYEDINEDDRIDDLDRKAIGGTYDPQVVYGFGGNMRYKNFDGGFFFQGIGKTTRSIGGSNFIPGSGSGSLGNILSNANDRWSVENPVQDVFYPRLSGSVNSNNVQRSTWWIRDMSFLRLKNVEIGYNLSKNISQKLRIQNARFFVRGSNLLVFSDFKLWDPEVGTDNGLRYPIMKSFSIGLQAGF